MGDEDYTELYETDIIPNTREYYDVYPNISINMEEFEFHPEPRTVRVSWTVQTFDNLEDWLYSRTDEHLLGGKSDDTIERKRKKHRGNSRKYRTIRI